MENSELPFMAAARIFNGTYTLHNTRTGEHRTLDISTAGKRSKLAGKRIISLLTGPDNTRDYKGFGFVENDGVIIWKKYRGTRDAKSDYEKMVEILWSLWYKRAKSPYAVFGIQLIEECTCVYCNRKLTDPLSALTGVGPECADMRGIERERLPQRLTIESQP